MDEIIKIGLRADPGDLIKGFAEAEGAIAKFGQGIQATTKIMQAAGQAMQAVEAKLSRAAKKIAASGVGTSLAFAGMSAKASDFQRSMLNVQSIARLSEFQFMRTGEAVLSMSRNMPQSAKVIADGLYDVQAAGFAGAGALEITEQSAIAASAGLTDTTTSARAITAALNSYGLQAGDAADISDTLFKAVDVGVITFEELAGSMGDWVGMAAAVGVQADEATAAIAAMTLAGMGAAEASTSLARLMQSFIDPSENLTAVVKELGYESAALMLDQLGLQGTMEALRVATGGTAEAYTALFPEIRSVRGALALAANDGENYARVASQITNENARAGASMQAFQIQTQGFGAQFDILKNSFMAVSIELGSTLLPMLTLAVKTVGWFVDRFSDLPKPIKNIIAVMGSFAAVISAVIGLLGLLVIKGIAYRFVMTGVAAMTAKASASMAGLAVTTAASSATQAEAGGAAALLAKGLGIVTKGAQGASGAFNAASKGAKVAASSNGVLGTSYKAVAVAAGKARTGSAVYAASLVGIIAASLALMTALHQIEVRSDKAVEAGKEMAEEFADAFEVDSFTLLKESLVEVREEIEKTKGELESTPEHRFWDNEHEKLRGYVEGLEVEGRNIEREIGHIQDSMMGVFAQTRLDVDVERPHWMGDDKEITDYFSLYSDAAEGMLGDLDMTEGDVFSFMGRIADAFNIDPSQGPTEFGRQLRSAMDVIDGSDSGGLEDVNIALWELGETADTTSDRIGGLGNVLDALFTQEFGLEAAVDNTQGSINDLYESVLDLKEAGRFDDAMNLDSFSNEAMSVRADMRGLTEDYINQSIVWAETQDNMSGADFLSNLKEQGAAFRQAATDAGVAQPVIDRYVSMIEGAAMDREIAVRFNQSDLSAMEFVTDALVEHLGLLPEDLQIGLDIYKEDGEAALREWMEEMEIASDSNVENVVDFSAQAAMVELGTFMEQRGVAEADILTVIKTSRENPEELDDVIADLEDFNQEDYAALVEITGGPESELVLELLNGDLTALKDTDWTPEVDVNEDPAMAALERVEAKLAELGQAPHMIQVQVIPPSGFWVGGNWVSFSGSQGGNADGGIDSFARGGFSDQEQHHAQIARPQADVRVWAEPETGGEAYIPLSPAKRGRSQAILSEVARRFGGTVNYAEGGYWEYSPSESKPIFIPYDQNPSTSDLAGRFPGGGGSGGSSGGGGGGGGGTSSASNGALDAMDRIADQYELGEIAIDEYLAKMQEAIKGFDKYSDEYMTLSRRIESISAEILDTEKKKNEIMLELGEINEDQHLAYLDRRIANEEKYSDEWWNLSQERLSLEEDMAQRQRNVEEMMLETGILSEEQYREILVKRLASLRQFSDDWFTVWKQLQQSTEQIIVDVESAQKRYDDLLERQQRATEDHNRGVLDTVDDFRRQIQEQLQAARDVVTGPIESLTNATQHFGGELVTSKDEILEYYRHVTEGARRFQDTMRNLEEAGLDESILEQLYAAGPEALNVAEAFEDMIGSGDINEVNALAREIQRVADSTGDMYMRTRGTDIVADFGLEEGVNWMDRFGVSLDVVNARATDMANNFDGVRRSLELLEEIASEVAEALEELELRQGEAAEAEAANEAASGSAPEITPTESPVAALYRELFDREPDAAGDAFWTAKYAGGMSLDAIRETMKQSDEYLAQLYRTVLGREPDASGFAYWQQRMAQGMDADDIERYMRASNEYISSHARGGFLPGGRLGLVGEKGPELWRAPQGGAMIYPSGHGNAGGDQYHFESIVIGDNANITRQDVELAMENSLRHLTRTMKTGSRM